MPLPSAQEFFNGLNRVVRQRAAYEKLRDDFAALQARGGANAQQLAGLEALVTSIIGQLTTLTTEIPVGTNPGELPNGNQRTRFATIISNITTAEALLATIIPDTSRIQEVVNAVAAGTRLKNGVIALQNLTADDQGRQAALQAVNDAVGALNTAIDAAPAPAPGANAAAVALAATHNAILENLRTAYAAATTGDAFAGGAKKRRSTKKKSTSTKKKSTSTKKKSTSTKKKSTSTKKKSTVSKKKSTKGRK